MKLLFSLENNFFVTYTAFFLLFYELNKGHLQGKNGFSNGKVNNGHVIAGSNGTYETKYSNGFSLKQRKVVDHPHAE